MIDEHGYRANVGIVLCNEQNHVLWAHRMNQEEHAWQFPQGGIHSDETPKQAMYRELYEEVGLMPQDVKLLGQTHDWLSYEFGKTKLTSQGQHYIGQKQLWFLLRLLKEDTQICLTKTQAQEFDKWQWVDYDYPVTHIVAFKKHVYQLALAQLRVFL
ncbi:MAG: RNA pyrophosphohydrolase [Taibaiella sp.]|jgi:putative (di)nucleoside polyphosphate hydrolase